MKKRKIFLFAIIFALAILISNSYALERGENWERTNISESSFNLKIYNTIINYYNGSKYVKINTTIGPSQDLLFDYHASTGIYNASFIEDPSLGNTIKFIKNTTETIFDPEALDYKNVLDQIQQISIPDSSSIGSPKENIFTYPNVYGPGINLTYKVLPSTLKEELTINNFSDLIAPEQFIIDGKNVTLDLNFVMVTNAQHIVIDGIDWDKSSDQTTSNEVLIKDSDGKLIYTFQKPYARDSNGSRQELKYKFKKQGSKLFVSVRTPYDWLNAMERVYPVFIDPTISVSENGKDAHVQEDDVNKNFGSNPELHVRGEGSKQKISYLEFNISSIPENQTIQSAALCLYQFEDKGFHNISSHHVYTTQWNESTITWNNQPCGTSFNNETSCNLTAESNITNDGTNVDLWQCWSVKNMISSEHEKSSGKISIALRTNTDIKEVDKFYSKEHLNSSLWPYLNVTYSSQSEDTTSPYFTFIPSDQEIAYLENFQADFDAEDETQLDSYKINWTVYFMINQSGFITNTTSLPAGVYKINVTINDSSNNLNSTIYTLEVQKKTSSCTIQSNSPQEYPNPINVTASCDNPEFSANLFRNNKEVNSENGQQKILGAGNYSYVVNVTATQNYTNASAQIGITINQNSSYTLQVSGISPIVYGAEGDFQGAGCPAEIACILYRNNISTSNPDSKILSAGNYTYIYNSSGNSNYTAKNSAESTLTINKAQSQLTLTLNNSESNITISEGETIYLNGTLIEGEGEIKLYKNGSLINSGTSPIFNLTSFTIPGLHNITLIYEETQNYTSSSRTYYVNATEKIDTEPPIWTTEPQNQTINQSESLIYQIEATDNMAIDSYFIDDTQNFTINQSGFITNATLLQPVHYALNISVNDTSNNILSKTITIFVNSSQVQNSPPEIHHNITIVNNKIKIPEFGENFFVQVNISDPENDTIQFVNFTFISPNGTKVINNIMGEQYLTNNYSIWNSTNYTIDAVGIWNYSYTLSDNTSIIRKNHSFRVFSPIFIFPSEFHATPDPRNQTLSWNLSLYHSERKDYKISFTSTLNKTYFNITFQHENATINNKIYNNSNLFKNQIIIKINESILSGLYYGNITIYNQVDGKNYTLPIIIGVNPPSGNIDAFHASTNEKCLQGSCSIDTEMENDEARSFSWKMNNTGNFSLSSCIPKVDGFDISGFGAFSHTGFNLSIGETTILTLTIKEPPINTYYGNLEVICASTELGFNNSLESEPDNAPSIKILVKADSGSSSGGSGDGGGTSGGGGSTGIVPGIRDATNLKINHTQLSQRITIKRGTSETISLEVANEEAVFLNSCSPEIRGPLFRYFRDINQTEGLSPGEKYTYSVILDVPLDSETGEFTSDISIVCDEGFKAIPFTATIFTNSFEPFLIDYERVGTELRAVYQVREFAGESHFISLTYEMIDFENFTTTGGSESFSLGPNQDLEYILEFELPKDSVGEFTLKSEFSDGETTTTLSEEIFLSSTSITGLAISEENQRTLTFAGIALITGIIVFFAVRYVQRKFQLRKTIKHLRKKHKHKTIKLDIDKNKKIHHKRS